jgi:hypothetical protein
MPDPLLDYSSRLTESSKIGQAVRTGQVYDPFSGQTMIRTQAPPNPYYNMSYEEAARRRAIESENLQREVRTRSELLDQKVNDAEYKYKLSTIDQSEKFLEDMRGLDPRSPDYITRRHELTSTYPLAAQNPKILNNLDLLDKTYSGIEQDKQMLTRQQTLANDAAKERDAINGRAMAAKLGGTRGVAMYEELLAQDPGNPIGVMAKMVDAQEQQSAIAGLRRLNLNEKEFYMPEVGPDGQPTERQIFDTARAREVIDSAPTTSNISSILSRRDNIRKSQIGEDYEKWPDDVKAEWEITSDILKRYRASTGQQEVAPQKKMTAKEFIHGK